MGRLQLIIFVLIVAAGCKVQKSSTTASTSNQSTVVPPDTVQITQIDSASLEIAEVIEVQDTVEIGIFRVIKDTITVIGVGDIMLGTNYPKEHYLPPDSGKYLLNEVYDLLSEADITFGNLEGVVLNDGGTPKNCKNPKACYLFRSPEYLAGYLKTSGFDLMSLANNHAGDFGAEGRQNTQQVLDSLGIQYSGQLNCPIAYTMVDGMKYTLVSFAPNVGTISIHDYNQARELVQKADSISDIVIVSFHGGAEGSNHEIVPKEREFYYGEDRGDVHEFARVVIDAGADIVFGHGPHVTRSIDIYNDRIISYSLGNFCTYGRFNLRGVNGFAPILKVRVDSEGKFLDGLVIPIYQPGAGGVRIDSQKRVITKLQELLEQNFPENGLSVDDTGIINYLKTEI